MSTSLSSTLATSVAVGPTTSTAVRYACLLDVVWMIVQVSSVLTTASIFNWPRRQPPAGALYTARKLARGRSTRIEEIFQAPVEEDDEYEESGKKENHQSRQWANSSRVMGYGSNGLSKSSLYRAMGYWSPWSWVSCLTGQRVMGCMCHPCSWVKGHVGDGLVVQLDKRSWSKVMGQMANQRLVYRVMGHVIS